MRLILLNTFLVYSNIIYAQKIEIVLHNNEGDIISNATIAVNNQTYYLQSNPFVFSENDSCVNNTYHIEVKHILFEPLDTFIKCPITKSLRLKLEEKSNTLSPANIIAYKKKPIDKGVLILSGKYFSQSLSIFGSPDPIKLLQFTPGISTGLEGTNDVYVRGGKSDQTLLIYDNTIVQGQNHLFGLLSAINGNYIGELKLFKGPIPVQYGSKSSGYIDIESPQPNLKNHLDFDIGLLSTSVVYRSKPLYKKWYIGLATRLTYADKIYSFFDESNVGFYDFNLNFGYHHKDLRMKWSYYQSFDKYSFPFSPFSNDINAINFKWNTKNGSFNIDKTLSKKSNFHAHLSYNSFNNSINDQKELNTRNTNHSTIWGLYNYKKIMRDSIILNVGLDSRLQWNQMTQNDLKIRKEYFYKFLLFTPFVSFEKDIKDININLGFRANLNVDINNNVTYKYLEPRFVFAKPFYAGKLQLSYDRQAQYLFDLNESFMSIPGTFLIATNDKNNLLISNQVATTYDRTIRKFFTTEFSIYYKKYANAFDFMDGAKTSIHTSPYSIITPTNAYAYGFESMINYSKSSRFSITTSYTYSRSFYQSDLINFGKKYPAFFDRPHIFNTTLSLQSKNKKFLFGCNIVLQSNRPITAPIAANRIIVFSEKNAVRLPVYKRVDLSFKYAPKPKKTKWKSTWNVSLYNAFNFKNVFAISYHSDINGANFKYLVLYPIIPTFSYQLKLF